MSDEAQGKFGVNLGAGMVLGVVLGLLATVPFARREAFKARAGWNLVPVIVAADQINAGTVITYDMISQRSVPEQFVTASLVKPDAANDLVGQKTLVSLEPGDLFMWNMLAAGHGDKTVQLIRAAEQQNAPTRLAKLREADMK